MTPEIRAPRNADHAPDVDLHDQIKCRAYDLYDRGRTDGNDVKDGLRAELPRVAYALAELEKYAKGEVGDTRR